MRLMERRKSACRLSSASTPNDEPIRRAHARFAAFFELRELPCQFLRREHLPLRGKNAEKASLRHLRADELRFLRQPLQDLRLIRFSGSRTSGNSRSVKSQNAPQPLLIFLRSLYIKLLLQFPHTNERHREHTHPPKTSQSFCARRRKINFQSILSGGSADRKNTSQPASVEFLSHRDKNYARSRAAIPSAKSPCFCRT